MKFPVASSVALLTGGSALAIAVAPAQSVQADALDPDAVFAMEAFAGTGSARVPPVGSNSASSADELVRVAQAAPLQAQSAGPPPPRTITVRPPPFAGTPGKPPFAGIPGPPPHGGPVSPRKP